MPLQGSGQISMRDIKDEFGPNPGNNIGPVSMEDYRLQEEDIDGLTDLPLDENAGPSNNTDIPRSGSMSFENFYNAKLNVVVRMTSNTVPGNDPSQQNARTIYNDNSNQSVVRCVGNLRSRPTAENMSGRRVIIDVNKQISSGSNQNNKNTNRRQCAMRTGEWVSGTKLTVHIGANGSIYGAGGDGGDGNSVGGEAEDGSTGTSALGIDFGTSSNQTKIINKGYIQAGYGGGGGGGGTTEDQEKDAEDDQYLKGGGGGGGAGVPAGEGGISVTGEDGDDDYHPIDAEFPGGDGTATAGGTRGDHQVSLEFNAISGEGGRGCDPQEPVDEGETTEGQTGEGGEENGTPGEAGSPGYSIIVEGASNTVDISEIESGSGSIAEETTRIIYSTNVVDS